MFTGIIEATGQICRLVPHGQDLTVWIDSEQLDFADVKLGDSIASNGVCLTVTELAAGRFKADLSSETLQRTLFGQYRQGQRLNLEKAMLPTTRLGGHLVSGHVDGISQIVQLEKSGRAWQVWVHMPAALARYIAEKGSVTVDGISLTVNELRSDAFRLTIVPHTAQQTTLLDWAVGSKVHLEVDLIARYLERLITAEKPDTASGVSMALLQQRGFL